MKWLAFTGDIALSGIINDFSEEELAAKLNLREAAGEVQAVINLEAPVAGEKAVPHKRKGVILRSSSYALESFLRQNRIAAVTLANNHSHDYGYEGIRETISILDSFNIPHTGAGYLPEHLNPAIFMVEETRYALLGYVHSHTNPLPEDNLMLNIYEKEMIQTSVRHAAALADRVIVSLHWGMDYSFYPLPWQTDDARAFIDAGADIIIGHHPHVIQPYEVYKGRYIFYSLGSTVFGDFYLRSRLRALPLKTKKSFIPVFSDLRETPDLIPVRELKGNRLQTENRDIRKWSAKIMRRARLKNRCHFFNSLVIFKERWIDRMFDVVAGYYRNPAADIFSAGAMKNAMRIIRNKRWSR